MADGKTNQYRAAATINLDSSVFITYMVNTKRGRLLGVNMLGFEKCKRQEVLRSLVVGPTYKKGQRRRLMKD